MDSARCRNEMKEKLLFFFLFSLFVRVKREVGNVIIISNDTTHTLTDRLYTVHGTQLSTHIHTHTGQSTDKLACNSRERMCLGVRVFGAA